MINLRKEAKINLVKGSKINLTKNTEKDGDQVRYVFAGANWSKIKSFWGGSKNVDLDLSAISYDENKKIIDINYYANLHSKGIDHSEDDLCGDSEIDDLDNEIISIDLQNIDPKTEYISIILNCFNHIDFGDIPMIELRIYTNDDGRQNNVDNVLASFKLDNNKEFSDKEAIVLGHFYKHNNKWKFSADGIGSKETSIRNIALGTALNSL